MDDEERERIRRVLANAAAGAATARRALLPLGPIVERANAELGAALRGAFQPRVKGEAG